MVENLFAVYSAGSEYHFEPMDIVPVAKPKQGGVPREEFLRVFVQRVIFKQFANTVVTGSSETLRNKSRGKPAMSDLCDGFFLNKLKQLQISQYNTDKTPAVTSIGARLIAQASPNTVTVIDVLDMAKWYVKAGD